MEWTRGQIIGRGSSAIVSIAKATKSAEIFAVKTVELSRADQLKKEQYILANLKFPQIVSYKGCDITSEHGHDLYNLFMEYVPGGTLNDAIQSHGGRLDEATIRSYTREILYGLVYLHASNIVHCDIKANNILIAKDGIKIADLGCARMVANENSQSTYMAGTPVYMAPEVARGEQQGCPADVWALGCTVIEMATGKYPWSGCVSDIVNTIYRIGFSGDVPEIPEFLSEDARDFIGKCLKRDLTERWSASELLEHGFLDESSKKGHVKETDKCKWDTPTSVLDQGFWESLETVQKQSFTKCPKERIQQLSEGQEIFLTRMSDWEFDWVHWDWVTVRSNCVDQEDGSYCGGELTSTSGADVTLYDDGLNSVCVKDACRNCMRRDSLMAYRSSALYAINYEMNNRVHCSNTIDSLFPNIRKSKLI